MNLDSQVSEALKRLAVGLLVHNLNWDQFVARPLSDQLAIASMVGLNVDALLIATRELQTIVAARREQHFRGMEQGDGQKPS